MNKKLFLLPALLISVLVSHAQFTDNFTDGDITANPAWVTSSATDWVVTAGQLQSNNEVANSTFYLSTASTLATTAQWEFFANLKFATSGANYVDVFLTASASDLSATATTGYFVRIGNTPDEISLYRKDGAASVKIIDGADGIVASSSNNLVRIKVVRDATNQWILSRDMTGGTSYTSEGTITDATFTASAFFGMLVKQSTVASFAKKHFFDDITVQAFTPDVTAPTVTSATVIGSTALDVLFNEPLDNVSSQVLTNYSVNNGVGAPATAVLDGSNTALVHLTFTNSFPNAVASQVTVNAVKDIAGMRSATAQLPLLILLLIFLNNMM